MIYFIQSVNGGPVKIGYAANIQERFECIQAMSPVILRIVSVMNGDRGSEGHLHRYFGKIRLHGEWFSPTEELLRFVKKPYPIECNASINICQGSTVQGNSCRYTKVYGSNFCYRHQSQVNGIPEIKEKPKLTKSKCKGITINGNPCSRSFYGDGNFCRYHSSRDNLCKGLTQAGKPCGRLIDNLDDYFCSSHFSQRNFT